MVTYYSKFKQDDVVALMPETAAAVQDPARIDEQALVKCFNKMLAPQFQTMEAFQAGVQEHKRKAAGSPAYALSALQYVEQMMAVKKRVFVFAHLAPAQFPGLSDTMRANLKLVEQRETTLEGFWQAVRNMFVPLAAGHGEAALKAVAETTPQLTAFIPETGRPAPTRHATSVTAEARAQYEKDVAAFSDLAKTTLAPQEKRVQLAQSLSGILRFKKGMAQGQGFGQMQDEFTADNALSGEMIQKLAYSAKRHMPELYKDLMQIDKILLKKMKVRTEDIHYEWSEAADIVTTVFTKISPELGKIARRAFDEHWIHASDGDNHNHVISSLPKAYSEDAHPFAIMKFKGTAHDVHELGHEMAHLVGNYLAAEKNGPFFQDGTKIVQEQFSHFFETLTDKEMQARAQSDELRLRLRVSEVMDEANVVVSIFKVEWEKELYDRLQKKGPEGLSYDEINGSWAEKQKKFLPDLPAAEVINILPDMWHIINLAPLSRSVYPIAKAASGKLIEACEADSEAFGRKMQDAMEAGRKIDIKDLWGSLLGEGVADHKDFFEARLKDLVTRVKALKREIGKMPDLPPTSAPALDASMVQKYGRTNGSGFKRGG